VKQEALIALVENLIFKILKIFELLTKSSSIQCTCLGHQFSAEK
jgi:hypothetical protein